MMNRLHNCQNPHQGLHKRILCICSAGLLRSPTAAEVLREEYEHNTRSAGLADYALIEVDSVLVAWADEIVVMQADQAEDLIRRFNGLPPVTCLDIPDEFAFRDRMLVETIKERYAERGEFAGKQIIFPNT
jgi:predicted protein tyrosine phosphatase